MNSDVVSHPSFQDNPSSASPANIGEALPYPSAEAFTLTNVDSDTNNEPDSDDGSVAEIDQTIKMASSVPEHAFVQALDVPLCLEGGSEPVSEIMPSSYEVDYRPILSKLTVRTPNGILGLKLDRSDIYLGNGLLSKGNPFVLVGPSGVGKSRVLLQLAISTIVGKPFLGIDVHCSKKKWLIVQTENCNQRLQDDLNKMRSSFSDDDWNLIDDHLVFHTVENEGDAFISLKNPVHVEELENLVLQTEADIVSFDPLNAFASGLNSDDGMLVACRELQRISKIGNPNTSVVVVHHSATGAKGAAKAVGLDRASYGKGSKSLHAWTRGQINIAPGHISDTRKIVLSCGKTSNGEEFRPIGAKLNPVSMFYEVDGDFTLESWQRLIQSNTEQGQKHTPESVAALLETAPTRGNVVIKNITLKFGCEKSTAYAALQKAVGAGLVLKRGRDYMRFPDPPRNS